MSFLENLFGGGNQQPQYQQRQQEFEDFATRYDQGSPYEGFTDQEALSRYQQVAGQVPPDVYQQSAQEAFTRMSPAERMQLGQMLMQQSQQQGVSFPDMDRDGRDDRLQDPRYLAQVTGQMEQQQPGILGQLLGGNPGGATPGGGAGNLLGNPVAKAALGGIAAMAVRRMMSGR